MSQESSHDLKQCSTGCATERTQHDAAYTPRVDLVDTNDSVILVADVPGVDENSVEVSVEKNVLTIRGTVASQSVEGYAPVRHEYGVGNFERSFTLSDQINRDGIQATVKNGVLRMTLPKSKQSLAQKVTVTAG